MLQSVVPNDVSGILRRYDVARALTLLIILGVTCTVIGLPLLFGAEGVAETLTLYLVRAQDLPLAPIFLCAVLLRPVAAVGVPADRPGSSLPVLALSVLAILLVGGIGHQIIFQGFELSRDEQMALFDQEIFERGRLFWPIPEDWRSIADALNRRFILPIGANEYWVSAYLPIHAAFRALLGSVGLASMASALLTVLGAVGMWSVARRLWPQSERTVIVSLVLLVTSSQVLIASMTAFSMSMHLALNLLWLALFLSDRRASHIAAAFVAFLATGIHQPLFHPLFALPFVLLLAWQRRWHLFAFYGAAYAIIGLFWLAWPIWITSHGVSPPAGISCGAPSVHCMSGISYGERLLALIGGFDLSNIWFTAANLLRFILWQHPILLPLALFGAISCWRDPLVKALAVSFILPIAFMAIVLPWQGHGWGYRYVHPVLGNAILLACYGFHSIAKSGLSFRRPLIISTVLAVMILPVHAWMAARLAEPFVHIRKELAAIPADVVIVDADVTPYGQDVVFNRFDLSNRPTLLVASLLRPADISALCRRSTIAFYDGPRMAGVLELFKGAAPTGPSPQARALQEAAAAAGCRVVQVAS